MGWRSDSSATVYKCATCLIEVTCLPFVAWNRNIRQQFDAPPSNAVHLLCSARPTHSWHGLFLSMKLMSEEARLQNIDTLSEDHKEVFCRALKNLLSTTRSEYTYAQILGWLPTEESSREGYYIIQGHPVFELNHTQLCPGFLEKARKFRDQLDYSSLHFQEHVSQLGLIFQMAARIVG